MTVPDLSAPQMNAAGVVPQIISRPIRPSVSNYPLPINTALVNLL
jgi:hypothetical protein